MREEINWRVKAAYNSSIAFISVIAFIIGQLYSQDNKIVDSFEKDPNLVTITSIGVLVILSAWVIVQNANHLIEKRIELYSLTLIQKIYDVSGHVFFSWLGYLYGKIFFRQRFKNKVSKLLNASIGFCIYFLPNLIAFLLWCQLWVNENLARYYMWFFIASLFVLISILTSFLLFFYVIKIDRRYTDFYKEYMEPYYKNKPK